MPIGGRVDQRGGVVEQARAQLLEILDLVGGAESVAQRRDRVAGLELASLEPPERVEQPGHALLHQVAALTHPRRRLRARVEDPEQALGRPRADVDRVDVPHLQQIAGRGAQAQRVGDRTEPKDHVMKELERGVGPHHRLLRRGA